MKKSISIFLVFFILAMLICFYFWGYHLGFLNRYEISDKDVLGYSFLGKHGLCDKNHKLITKPIFEDIGRFVGDLARTRSRQKWGYIDKQGQWVIPNQYDDAYPFENQTAVVSIKGKYGIIDIEGKYIIEPKYDDLSNFSDGLACAGLSTDGKYINRFGYLNTSGEVKIPFNFVGAKSFSEGLAAVSPIKKKIILEGGKSDKAMMKSLGMQLLKRDFGYIDLNGNYVINPKFYTANDFHDGRAVVATKHDLYGIIDKKGDFIVKPQFSYVRNSRFENGYAIVKLNNKCGVIDVDGRIVIPNLYDDIYHNTDKKQFVISKNGKKTIKQISDLEEESQQSSSSNPQSTLKSE